MVQKNVLIILTVMAYVFSTAIVDAMEPPPRDARPKHSLTEEDKPQPGGKKSKPDKPLIMPEFNEKTSPLDRALLEAVARGDLETVRNILPSQYVDGWIKDAKSRSLQYFAVANNHVEVMVFLLHRREPIQFHKLYDVLPKVLTVLKLSEEEMAHFFIEYAFSEDTNKANKKLFVALLLDLEEKIQEAINAGADVIGNEGDELRPLHIAVHCRSAVGIKLLLANGCPIDGLKNNGVPALQEAVIEGFEDIVEELLKGGANVNVQFTEDPMLHNAVRGGNIAIARQLVSHGADVNLHDTDGGKTPLHIAASCGRTECVKFLLEHHADVNARDDYGRTPLHEVNDNVCIVKLLLEHGTDVNLRTSLGNHWGANRTPLSLKLGGMDSSNLAHFEMIKELLLWGANIDKELDSNAIRRVFKENPLVLAIVLGDLSALTINSDTSVAALNEALVFAIAQQRSDFVELLINSGAQPYVGLEFLDRVFLRRYLTPQARLAYQKLQNFLEGQMSLCSLIMRRMSIHDSILKNPLLSRLPKELKEPLVSSILLHAIKSYNNERVERVLEAGADPVGFLPLVPQLSEHPEIAHLLVSKAQQQGIPCSVPNWLSTFRTQKQLVDALRSGSVTDVKEALREGADPHDATLVFLANLHAPDRALQILRILFDAYTRIPEGLFARLDNLRERPQIAAFIFERAQEFGVQFSPPMLLLEWSMQK